jgi:hypothetical protein
MSGEYRKPPAQVGDPQTGWDRPPRSGAYKAERQNEPLRTPLPHHIPPSQAPAGQGPGPLSSSQPITPNTRPAPVLPPVLPPMRR